MPALAPVDFLAAVVAIYATTVLGFAGALQELGLPRQAFVTGLMGFNVGVEGGQLAVIGAAFLTVGRFRRRP